MDKKSRQLRNAINEAKRFIAAGEVALLAIEEDSKGRYRKSSLKEVAAAKRASMDLTRSLVPVRGSN